MAQGKSGDCDLWIVARKSKNRGKTGRIYVTCLPKAKSTEYRLALGL